MITLPERRWHPDFMETGGKEYGLSEQLLREMLPQMSPSKTTSGALRLGDLLIIGIPGELAAGLGIQVKTQAKARDRRTTPGHRRSGQRVDQLHPLARGLPCRWL